MATGEGSRGGHIVRHTQGGKAVYGDPKAPSLKKRSVFVGGGVATSAIGGHLAGKLDKLAAHPENIARTAAKAGKFALKESMVAKVLQEAGHGTRIGAGIAGAALIYQGLSSGKKEESTTKRVERAAGAGAAATAATLATRFGVRFGYNKVFTDTAHAARIAFSKIKKPIGRR